MIAAEAKTIYKIESTDLYAAIAALISPQERYGQGYKDGLSGYPQQRDLAIYEEYQDGFRVGCDDLRSRKWVRDHF